MNKLLIILSFIPICVLFVFICIMLGDALNYLTYEEAVEVSRILNYINYVLIGVLIITPLVVLYLRIKRGDFKEGDG